MLRINFSWCNLGATRARRYPRICDLAKNCLVWPSKQRRVGDEKWGRLIKDQVFILSIWQNVRGFNNIVQKRGKMIGKLGLQPHDLKRTCTELGRWAGVFIEQISSLLGHATIKTTQDYLNIELNLETTVSDFVPF